MKSPDITIVVPVWNEVKTVGELIERIHNSLSQAHVAYELIFIDDRSTDGTAAFINSLISKYPISLYRKKVGTSRGKAESLLAGFKLAKSEIVAMIDADLEYPPEVIPEMLKLVGEHGVVIANRATYKSSWLRRIASRINRLVFGRLLFGRPYDVQSGLKVIRKEIIDHIDKNTVSSWALDMPILHTAQELGYTIGSVNIDFVQRKHGTSKVNFFKAAFEIAIGAVKLKLARKRIYHLPATNGGSMVGAGVAYKRKRFITHSTLPHHQSALVTFKFWQLLFIGLTLSVIGGGMILNPLNTAIGVIGVLSSVYFLDVFFNLFLVLKSLHTPPEISVTDEEIASLEDKNLPDYSILCPLYREGHVVPQFLQAIDKLDWPKSKLDVIILLEEDDKETIDATKRMDLPAYVRTLVVAHSQPKTKPKACNYGIAHARGEYVVVYDAEDIPDPKQLKIAYLAFQAVNPETVCLQAKLNYYNPHHNLLTKLFTAEYSLWFDVMLTGLQSINTSIPLGGTSNHFRTEALRKLHGWDAFNVTEDCDLGIRLFKSGYKTAIIDSTTLEEANSNFVNWLRQRSRWIKGYLQTYLVHMRDPVKFIREHGLHAWIFQLVVGGKIAFMYINPLLWMATIAYFTLYVYVGPTIESLYPPVIFYMAATSLVFGNFLFLYYYMIGCAKHGHWSVIKYVFLVPFYWLMVSVSAVIALVQLVFKPHYWEKTNHGFHLAKAEKTVNFAPVRSVFAGTGVFIVASAAASVLNFFYNAYLGRSVNVETFGKINLFGSFFYLVFIPIGALGRTITHRSAYLLGKFTTPVRLYWEKWQRPVVALAIITTLSWYLITPFLAQFFHFNDLTPFILYSPIWVFGLRVAVNNGYLGGTLQFGLLAILVLVDAVVKLALAVFFVQFGFTDLIYATVPVSLAITALVGTVAIKFKSNAIKVSDTQAIGYFPKRFFATSLMNGLSMVVFLTADVLLVNHFLDPVSAGHYALLSLVGKMIFVVGSLFGQFINPIVSVEVGAGRSGRKQFYQLLAVTTIVALIGFVVVGLFGHITVPLLFGSNVLAVIQYLPVYTLAMVCFTVASNIVTYHQVRREYFYSFVTLFLAFMQTMGIVYLHSSVGDVVAIMFGSGLLNLFTIGIFHIFQEQVRSVLVNISDFWGLFGRIPETATVTGAARLRILIFNWRDTRHVWAGGAEVYIHELSKRWVSDGNKVTVFCGNDGKCPRNQVIDGVQIVRRGGFFTVYVWACLYYILRFRDNFDVVIDSENGIPFFSPLFTRVPTYLLIHHVHQLVFKDHLPYLLAKVAMFMESKLMPLVYKNRQIITVSESSKQEIIKLGFSPDNQISIVHPGVDITMPKHLGKASFPSFAYVGRLKPYKQIDTAIRAFGEFIKTHRTAKFTIAGEGESMNTLQKLSDELGLTNSVIFMGRVNEDDKYKVMTSSWAVIQPSSVEGWGMTVIETNACGTPVIASNVLGLRDSVVHEQTGLLVQSNNVLAFINAMSRITDDKQTRKRLSRQALVWAGNFSWDKSAENFYRLMTRELTSEGRPAFSFTYAG